MLDDVFFAKEQSEAWSSADLSDLSIFSEGPQEAGAWGDQLDDDNVGDNRWSTLCTLARTGNWLWNLLDITKICKPSS